MTDNNQDKLKEFELVVEPVMKWLAENHHPHTKIIIESNSAELLQSEVAVASDEFLVD
ncbi:hypothetical protein [Providencia rustigianii]|uniref:hypothetical protein n=1 Tax=Providencia rustigianii TaxID=158850 RepID=UPI000F6DDD42|nr:hypothetical protein [Providencia rustigianii]VEH55024.1 Uncharacterised protein [Providencia rustigianii]